MWKYRNGILHGTTEDETKQLRRKRLQQQIDLLYERKKELYLPDDLKVFQKPARFRKSQGLHQMELWIGLAEDTLRLFESHRKDNPLLRWLITTPEGTRED